MTIAFRPLRNPNPLGFPGGVLPGVDWSHPAANGVRFSGIALSGGARFVNLLTGKTGTNSGTPSSITDGKIGPATNFAGVSDQTSFTGNPLARSQSATIGMIFVPNSASTQFFFASSGTNGTGIAAEYTGGAMELLAFGVGGAPLTGLAISANTPYFFAASIAFSPIGTVTEPSNGVLVNLASGALLSSSVTWSANADAASDGTYVVGNRNTGGTSALSKIAAVVFSANYLQLPQLLAWAADPWAFWYPRRDTMLVGAAAAAFKAYWAQQNNLPVIGAGTY